MNKYIIGIENIKIKSSGHEVACIERANITEIVLNIHLVMVLKYIRFFFPIGDISS